MIKIENLILIWIDASLGSKENLHYLEILNELFKRVICLRSIGELIDYLKNNENKFILLVSGRIGEELVRIGFNSENLIGEFVFC